ncbi:MAG TPA: PilZ domain-containing protein [Bacillota bacterium]
MEKRKKLRIKTHSAAKLVSSTQLKLIYGYLDNLSEDGMGIMSPEWLAPGSRFTCGFFLKDGTEKVNTIATLVHTSKGIDSIYYHGFRFDYISSLDRQAVADFINRETKSLSQCQNIV